VEDALIILVLTLVQLLQLQNQLLLFLMMKAATVDSIQELKLETLVMEIGASIQAMEMVAIKVTILAMAINTLLYLDLEVASMFVKTNLTDVG